jgi:hypothetical protein
MSTRSLCHVTFAIVWLLPVAESHAQYTPLYLDWIGVIDNGEGDGMHGPHGNLHIDTWNAVGAKVVDNEVLIGPSSREFLDGDQARYGLLIGMIGAGNLAVRVKIWESDPGPFREHEVLFDQWIAGPGLYYSGYAAPADAVRNARRRGANAWVSDLWRGGVQSGIPKMFVKIEGPALGLKRPQKSARKPTRPRSSATATIHDVWVAHNAFEGALKGMTIHCNFSVDWLRGYEGAITAYFYFENGQALKDYDGDYSTTSGNVSVGETFSPRYDNAIYDDFAIFMPYDEFHMASGTHDLELFIEIWDESTRSPRSIARSRNVYFEFSSR